MTISCSSVGLDITAASRVYLMEPQWNPKVEEQALARVHRISQTKEVITTRYVMKDSLEEHVINIQGWKKKLADLLLSHNPDSGSESGGSRLESLLK
ncbi:MAG: hypothetical protein M1840_006096 [Geoglossum simile]|nr:MAG: hypothetical protein M1840_006096 [Geoglossum simile]